MARALGLQHKHTHEHSHELMNPGKFTGPHVHLKSQLDMRPRRRVKMGFQRPSNPFSAMRGLGSQVVEQNQEAKDQGPVLLYGLLGLSVLAIGYVIISGSRAA